MAVRLAGDRVPPVKDGTVAGDGIEALSGKQSSHELSNPMNSLPERQRNAFQLKGFHGVTIREVAQIMDSAAGTMKSHFFQTTRFLREALNDWAVPEGEVGQDSWAFLVNPFETIASNTAESDLNAFARASVEDRR